MRRFEIYHGDALETLKILPDCSVDSVVTDPPYGISFMGKKWDHSVPGPEYWAEALRVLKPGGHLLAFAGTRTQHRMASAIEDAGFEIRDMMAWVYAGGFPKSHNVGKAIDKLAGAEREVLRTETRYNEPSGIVAAGRDERVLIERKITAPATDEAKQWEGWGTALKPALEPLTLARKPFKTTVAKNVLAHGTGALNIDACRVETQDNLGRPQGTMPHPMYWGSTSGEGGFRTEGHPEGRWPANLLHDGSEEVLEVFPETGASKASMRGDRAGVNTDFGGPDGMRGHNDAGGSAARFFYCAKASKKDRDEGCEMLPAREVSGGGGTNDPNGDDVCGKYGAVKTAKSNHHPTVKPTKLMRYLCRLVTPPGGVVLDPFMGSGSTGKAALLEGFRFIGIEREQEYCLIAWTRMEAVRKEIDGA